MYKYSKDFLKYIAFHHNHHKQVIKIRHEAKINKMVNKIIKSSNKEKRKDDRCKLTRR